MFDATTSILLYKGRLCYEMAGKKQYSPSLCQAVHARRLTNIALESTTAAGKSKIFVIFPAPPPPMDAVKKFQEDLSQRKQRNAVQPNERPRTEHQQEPLINAQEKNPCRFRTAS
nr:hypothetical protein [uncultured Desulfobulbus sp.]